MRDAIVFSTWSWETFNVPERIALALVSQGSRVLYCEIPVSRFRSRGKPLLEIQRGLHVYGPEYSGARLNRIPFARESQWKKVANTISDQAKVIGLRDPVFLYSHIEHLTPLCQEMRSRGLPLVHICMDYPEPYQYELIDISERTLVIPKTVFHKLKAKYGEKIQWIPQSIALPTSRTGDCDPEPQELAGVPRPRLGYLGPLFGRINLQLLETVLANRPEWHFVYFGPSGPWKLPNAHSAGWHKPEELGHYVSQFDVGVMPYDCFEEKNLHCSPLKLLDYFLAGLPVVSTPILALAEWSDLVYVGETPAEFTRGIELALNEPTNSPKREARKDVALSHSVEFLGSRMAQVLPLNGVQGATD